MIDISNKERILKIKEIFERETDKIVFSNI